MNRKPGESDVMYHGPNLVEFLRGKGVVAAHLPHNMDRAMRRWRDGERATERMVDELCCHLGWGSHMTAIPHDLIVKGRELIEMDRAA